MNVISVANGNPATGFVQTTLIVPITVSPRRNRASVGKVMSDVAIPDQLREK